MQPRLFKAGIACASFVSLLCGKLPNAFAVRDEERGTVGVENGIVIETTDPGQYALRSDLAFATNTQ